MSFSRRYAKQRSKPMEGIRPEERDESLILLKGRPQGDIHFTIPEEEIKKERQIRFLGRSKAKQVQAEEDFKRRFTHQASRLRQPYTIEEENSAPHWRRIFWSIVLIAWILIVSVAWRYSNQWIFPIRHVELKGEFSKVDPLALQGVLSHYATGSLLFFSASELRERLQDLPWIDQALIHRQWPTTLEVTLNQKQPMVRYGENQLLGKHGELFAVPNMAGLENLPSINGPDDRAMQLWQTYNAMNQVIAPYNLKVWRLDVSPRLAYTLVLNNGITLYLGADDAIERLRIFAKVYAKTLKTKIDQIQYADLRYHSGMAVAWKEK